MVAETWGASLHGAEEMYWIAFMTGVFNFFWVLRGVLRGFTLWFLLLGNERLHFMASHYGAKGSVFGFLVVWTLVAA